jgi:hypothetical protein
MEKIAISVLLGLLVGGAAVGGMYYLGSGAKGADNQAVADLRADVQAMQQAVAALKTEVQRLGGRHNELANAMAARADSGEKAAVEPGAEGGAPAVAVASGLREQVFALIDEERKLREEERKQQREEADKKREERRKEIDELSKGPYDRLNLKVNSMAKALAMDDTQRDKFFEVTKKYRDKIDAERQALFAQFRDQKQDPNQPGAQPGGQPGGRGGVGRENFEKLRELMTTTQKDYAAEVQGILTAPQVATFTELSQSSQSFMGSGLAVKDGEDDGGTGGRMGDMMRGMMGPGNQQGRQRGGQSGPGGRNGG